ncbi:MAG: hypothetical protein P4L27_04995 [Ignavibacteriaceae bacterium]|jgi:hypothetical protein|nr:hypothetical protein [Ignavibacteriaceae bacterium]
MAKINLTTKPISEQVRILKDYLIRRAQHKTQGEVSIDQVIKKFKHKKLLNNRTKAGHFDKLLKMIKNDTQT